MAVCTFFGHKDCPEAVSAVLRETLSDLIVNHGVDRFYVGNQGRFDAYVRNTLRALLQEHPHIRYAVVLAHMPRGQDAHEDFSDTMLPEGIEAVHPRFAISWRNNWMLRRSDFVVSYIAHPWGGAYRYAETARKQGKQVINLA